jgi:hypothetical protein
MLNDIIAGYLDITPAQANSLLDLITREGYWQDPQLFPSATMKTQLDFVSALDKLAQSKWFQGNDRSQFAANSGDAERIKSYYVVFEAFGLTLPLNYSPEKNGAPDFAIVLGSHEKEVQRRTATLEKDLQADIIPTHKTLFGLGCNRLLGVSATADESASKQTLVAQGKDPIEMNMVTLVVREMLKSITHGLNYIEVNTVSAVQSRQDPACVKTGDTAATLRHIITEKFPAEGTRKRTVVAYSSQPYVLRQQRDIQAKLGTDFTVVGVGEGYTLERFMQTTSSVNNFLGEIARLVHINFTLEIQHKLALFALSVDELAELAALQAPVSKPEAVLNLVAHSFLNQGRERTAQTDEALSITHQLKK